jgi:hypothetical protein
VFIVYAMKTTELKEVVERQPFRPFGVRLSNGAMYFFNQPRELGATQDLTALFFFGQSGGFSLIDSENIVEVVERPASNGA